MSYHYTNPPRRGRPGYGGMMSWLAPASDIVNPALEAEYQVMKDVGVAMAEQGQQYVTSEVQQAKQEIKTAATQSAAAAAETGARDETYKYWAWVTTGALILLLLWVFTRK